MNAESTRAKLKIMANNSDKNFMELFKQLTFERFLVRVASSNYRDNLIFKGGLCLKQYVDTNRETKDIDFLIKQLDGKIKTITQVFEEISNINLDDSYQFQDVRSSVLEADNKKYPGVRLKIGVSLGKMKDSLQIDIGIGDIVDEYEMGLNLLEYKDEPLLKSAGVSLLAYPPEFIFSEKLQAILELKTLNSRMKDYFDCYTLINENIMDSDKVINAVTKTFQKRETKIELIEDFSEELDEKWKPFRNKIKDGPDNIKLIIDRINNYLKKIKLIK